MRSFLKLSLFLLIFPLSVEASWPTFQVIRPEEIMHKVIIGNCPVGEGYIAAGTKFQIDSASIPSDQVWNWVYTGTSECQKLPTQAQQLKYMFYEQNGRYAGSTITAIYGIEKIGPLFTFTFRAPAKPKGWDCGPFAGHEPPIVIGCARDMK